MRKIERREYPRVEAQLPAEILDGKSNVIGATVVNLSRVGLRIACDRPAANRLLSHDRNAIPEFDVCFSVPEPVKTECKICARCRVVTTHRISRNEFQLSLLYTKIENDGYDQLQSYILARSH